MPTTEADARALKNELKRKAEHLRDENREEKARNLIGAAMRIAGASKQNGEVPDRISSSDQIVSEETEEEMQRARKLLEDLDLE
jgi:transaldolase